jgi:Tol biopolymer transport system component
MPLAEGSRVGPYLIVSAIGAGGMGEVYRARDSRLNRDVALKVLPDVFAADADRLARFTREAQALAALNHPNIAHIHGLEDQGGGATALVMELVEGEELAAHVARGPLPIPDVVAIARQLADALESAHEQGIVHRDLKPANIKLTSDGVVKVLDFGLAKAMETGRGDAAAADSANSPTLTARATQMGVIVGTAAYMAPEQAKGKPVDRRVDIWAFGAVLFEMLTGRRAFEGDDVSSILAAVLMKDPDWAALPASTPVGLTRLVRRCLERDPRLRLRDVGEARVLLGDAAALNDAGIATVAGAGPPARRPLVPWLIAGLSLAAAMALAVIPVLRGAPPAPLVQFNVSYPLNVRPMSNGSDYHGGEISPDGRMVAFSGTDSKTGRVALYVRRIDSVDATMVKGTEGGRYPFWAPTSRAIAFYALGKLNRVDLDGSSRLVICDAPTGGWGGAWNSDDVIVAGVNDPGPLVRVSARGGEAPRPITTLLAGDNDHDWAQFLPDGRQFIYTAWRNSFTGNAGIYLASLDAPGRTLLLNDVFDPAAFADPGHLLFIRDGTLMAQEFDLGARALRGTPTAVANNAAGPISASASGAISYTTTRLATSSRMLWVNRDGTDERVMLDSGFYADPAISPNGLSIAYARKEAFSGTFDVFVRTLATGAESRLTFDPADDRSPVWSPDSREIVFSSGRTPIGLYRKQASGAGAEVLVTEEGVPQVWPYQWSRDGFITSYGDDRGSWDIWKLGLTDLKSQALLHAPRVNESRGSVSPDGKWLAYDARETARFEVFLTTFPPSASKLAVTTEGGAEAKWSRDGKELFYVNSATGALMSSPLTLGNPPTFGTPRIVHAGPLDWGWNSSHSFDLHPTNGRVLIEVLDSTGDLTVLLNWREMLRR